jgi:TolB-like protein/DNA-binding winged helix-turn-helix (wHTH) protein
MDGSSLFEELVRRFGVFELDSRAGQLRKSGVVVRLPPQPFKILTLLTSRPDQIVTREDIRRQIWGDETFVDFEQGLNHCIRQIRAALGDDAETPRYIETLPRRGYRFVYPVTLGSITPSETAPGDGHAIAGEASAERREGGSLFFKLVALAVAVVMLIVAAVASLNVAGLRNRLLGRATGSSKIRSIAVLPLKNLSGDPDQEYFAEGLTEELITTLGKISALRVISRTSVMRYKETTKPLPEIARDLNVDAIVEGTVQRSGNRVRITANLLYAPTDQHLWAESYERDLHDELSLQDDVARDIATAIRVNVTPQEHTHLTTDRPVNPKAYEDYLKGMQYWYKFTPQDWDTALGYYQLALREDPNSALAYVGICLVWFGRAQLGLRRPSEVVSSEKAAALKAIGLDPTLPEAHFALAVVRAWGDWDWSGAEPEFEKAIDLNPNFADARAFYSYYLMMMRRPEAGMRQMDLAVELDPLNGRYRVMYAVVLTWVRRYDDAIAQALLSSRTTPGARVATTVLWFDYFLKGMQEDALSAAKVKISNLAGSGAERALEQGYAKGGYQLAMRRAADALAAYSYKSYVGAENIADFYFQAGDKSKALDWMEKALEAHDPNLPFALSLPVYDGLHSEPRFQDLLRRMNFPQ